MPNINSEIEQAAEAMEKSTQSPKEKLFETIRKLGPEGIKAKLPTLAKSERELLCSALEEMKKAVSMDDQYAAKYVQGKITDTKIQEDKADDDQDEKLVKPEAAKHNHQGTPSGEWQGQVIKSLEASDEQMDILIEKAMSKCNDVKMVGEKLEKKGMDKKKVQGAIDRYSKKKSEKEEMEKGKKREEVKEEIMQMEEKEHGSKDPKKVMEAEKKEHKMKKSEELEKGKAKMLAEEEQSKDDLEKLQSKKARGDKSRPEELKLEEDNKDAQKKVNDLGQGKMKKAIWGGDNDLIKARTGGRNHHFSVNDYYDQVLADAEKMNADEKKEEVKKSETTEYDVNDVIAKGEDASRDDVICKSMVAENEKKISGRFVKSFENKDIQEALGLSDEEAEKILGK